jgi:hypothetical protein
MDFSSCFDFFFESRPSAEEQATKQAILKAIEQVHMDYASSLSERTVTHFYKYNGPSTYNTVMTEISKRRDAAHIKNILKVLAKMYEAIGLHGFAGIIIQYDNTSIVVNNNGNIRRSIPLYCTLQMSKVQKPS